MSEIKFAKAIGANTDLLSAQAVVSSRDNKTLAAIISGSGDDSFAQIRQTVLQLDEKFFESTSPLDQRLDEVFGFLQETLSVFGDLQIIISYWQEGVLYLKVLGNHKAYLLRDNNLSELSAQAEKGQLISGFINDNDRVLLVSSKSIDLTALIDNQPQVWDETTVRVLIAAPFDDLEGEIENIIVSNEHTEPIAAVLAVVEPEIKPETLPAEPGSESEPQPETGEIRNLDVTLNSEHSRTDYRSDSETAFSQKPKTIFDFLFSINFKKFIPKNKMVFVIIGVLLFLILIFGITMSFYNKGQAAKNAQFNQFISAAKDKLNQAKTLSELDPKSAKQSLDEAKDNLDKAGKIKPKDSQIKDLADEISKNTGSILKIGQLNDWQVFLSLDLIKQGFSSNRFSYSLGKVLLLDDKDKSLVVVDLTKKSNQILAGQTQLGNARSVSINGDNAFVLSEDKGVVKVDIQNQKVVQVTKVDNEWGKITDIFGFSGNVYLLDSAKNQIWKYLPVAVGYSSKFPYLKNSKANLANAKSLKIDYSVWVMSGNVMLSKFTAGVEDFFSVGGLDKPIGSITSFFVAENEDKLLILDSVNSRLVVLKKNGQYLAQYSSDKFKNASDFAYDDKEHKLYLLSENKILVTDLK